MTSLASTIGEYVLVIDQEYRTKDLGDESFIKDLIRSGLKTLGALPFSHSLLTP